MPGGSKDLDKAKYWQQLLAEQKESSFSGSEFCRKRNIKPNQFWYWSAVLTKRQKKKGRASSGRMSVRPANIVAQATSADIPDFVPVIVSAGGNNRQKDAHPTIAAEVTFAGGCMRLFNGIDGGTLRTILLALQEAAI